MSLSSLLTKHCPKYEAEIPSTSIKKWFRPILVKEEKKLLTIQQFGNEKEMINCVVEVLESCFDAENFKELTIVDIEYLFILLRIKSIGSLVSPILVCPHTQENITLKIDLEELQINKTLTHSNIIDLGNNTILTMKHPTISMLLDDPGNKINETLYNMALKCMNTIQTDTELIECSMQSTMELESFLDNMTKQQFAKIIEFFDTMPKLEKTLSYTTSDGIDRNITLKGIKDFFV